MHRYHKIIFIALLTSSLVWWNMGTAPQSAFAFGSFPETWGTVYPDSSSNAASCQLCHQNGGGGDGWNAYGWSVRQQLKDQGLEITEAIQAVEAMDDDGNGQTNLEEINGNAQPGWTTGAVNTIFFRDGMTQTEQSPPDSIELLDVGGSGEENPGLTNPISATITNAGGISLTFTTAADGLLSPVGGTATASLPDHLFIVDQAGMVWQVNLTSGDKSLFLDISSSLVKLGLFGINYDERGLLGFAMHPDYANNGLVYTHASEPITDTGTADFSTMPDGTPADHKSIIAQWEVTAPSDPTSVVDPDSKKVLLRIDQPQFNHNGGVITFGPDDMLYIGLGDGGAADDQGPESNITLGHSAGGNAQDNMNPFGTILRIDPLGSNSTNGQYGIPADNPFVGDATALDEIFAYGLRNPFSFSFDRDTGELYAGDVGQNQIEEVNIITSGGNYGWPLKEGTFFFDANGTGNGFVTDVDPGGLPTDLIDPIAQYDHGEGLSVMGGFVYRGSGFAALQGRYIFGDWGGSFTEPPGRLFYLQEDRTITEFVIPVQGNLETFVTGFGQDAAGELYLLGNTTGTPVPTDAGESTGVALRIQSSSPTSNEPQDEPSSRRSVFLPMIIR